MRVGAGTVKECAILGFPPSAPASAVFGVGFFGFCPPLPPPDFSPSVPASTVFGVGFSASALRSRRQISRPRPRFPPFLALGFSAYALRSRRQISRPRPRFPPFPASALRSRLPQPSARPPPGVRVQPFGLVLHGPPASGQGLPGPSPDGLPGIEFPLPFLRLGSVRRAPRFSSGVRFVCFFVLEAMFKPLKYRQNNCYLKKKYYVCTYNE